MKVQSSVLNPAMSDLSDTCGFVRPDALPKATISD